MSDSTQDVKGAIASLGDPAARARFFELPERRAVMTLSVGAALVFIFVATLFFAAAGAGRSHPKTPGRSPRRPGAARRRRTGRRPPTHGFSIERLSILLLDYPSSHFPYPFTIQNFMHILFFIGLGELFVRWRVGTRELKFLSQQYLPEDEATVLQFADLGPVRRHVSRAFDGEHGFLPSLIDLSILQFQASRSVDQSGRRDEQCARADRAPRRSALRIDPLHRLDGPDRRIHRHGLRAGGLAL